MRYDRTAVILHWVVGLAVLAQFALGWWMLGVPKGGDGERAWWFNLHKSIGMTLGALVLLRLAWRLRGAPPGLPLPAWQRFAAEASHWGLYACMLTLPLSGFLGSVFSGYPIRYFGLRLPDAALASAPLKNLMSAVHETAAWALAALLALHIGAALWHLARRDGVFRRMWI
ncbi:MAG TPA: cytochrome b [Burkholderiales bacterium]|nr:cytochrome b [Burkholderiales bacterium]